MPRAPPPPLADQRADPRPDLLAYPPHFLDRPAPGIVERPVHPLEPRHHRARVAAAPRHQQVGVPGHFVGEDSRDDRRQVHAQLAHHLHDLGVYLDGRIGARRQGACAIGVGERVEEHGGHLRAPGVVGARKQHRHALEGVALPRIGHAAGAAGFRPRTNALMNRPSIEAATVSTSSPAPSRNARASSTWYTRVGSISTSVKPEARSSDSKVRSSSAPATQPIQSSTLRRISSGTAPRTTTSETANRPPGLSTRNASASTFRLSAERLMTQLEMITSIDASGSGIRSISPFRNSTLVTPGEIERI